MNPLAAENSKCWQLSDLIRCQHLPNEKGGFMSRGPGKLQRKIADIFRANPSETFTLVQLAKLVYPGLNIVEKKHLNAISRAVYGVLGEKSWPNTMAVHGAAA